jgi:hypothetical protein
MANDIIHVGDRVRVAGHGDRLVEQIDICLRPEVDSKGEEFFATVEAIEVSEEFGPLFVLQLEGGSWAYRHQYREIVQRGEHYAAEVTAT